MATTALIFPGQGSHSAGMDDAYRGGELFERGLELLEKDPFARLDEGTEWQQPAVFLCSVCAWDAAGRPEEAAAAGHSLGEFAALVAAGALDFEAAVGLVSLRGRLMAEAAASPPGGMLAMLGGDADAVAALAAELGLLVANDNAPGQVVLSGPLPQIDRATERGPAETGARVRPLAVSGAFHSAQMEPVVEPMREALAAAGFAEPAFPVYSCATAAPFEDPAEELARNIVRPVHWRETVLALREAGIDDFSELGPGRVLTGLVRRIVPQAEPASEAA
jgi:malonyl CoA-acyl carrier protein transacylase